MFIPNLAPELQARFLFSPLLAFCGQLPAMCRAPFLASRFEARLLGTFQRVSRSYARQDLQPRS